MKSYVVRQEDEADCGACCLLSILLYYGGYMPLELIKVDTLTNKNGTNFYNIKVAANRYGLDVTGRKQLKISGNVPCIAQVNIKGLFHFVVIYKITDKSLLLMDPSKGLVKVNLDDFYKVFTGYTLEFTPTSAVIYYKPKSLFINCLKDAFLSNIKVISLLLVVSLIVVFLSLYSTSMIEIVINNRNKLYIYFFIFMILLKVLFCYLENILIAHLNKNINNKITFSYLEHLFFLPFKYLQLKKKGDLINRLQDLNGIKDYFSVGIVESVINILYILVSSIILIKINLKLFMLLLFFSILYLPIAIYKSKKIYYEIEKMIENDNELMDDLVSGINNLWTIKILNKSKFVLKNINEKLHTGYFSHFLFDKKRARNDLLNNFYESISFAGLIIFGNLLNVKLSLLVVFIFIYNYFSSGVKFFLDFIPNYLYFKSTYQRINSLFYLEKEKDEGIKWVNGDITISNLSFSYDLKNIFDNFNLFIPMGSKILLKGVNGSGKSTLLNILFKITDKYSGLITINNHNLKEINFNEVRNNISYVSQNDSLLPGTILYNILLDEDYNDLRFRRISSLLYLDKIINNKVNGINTVIRDNLSGGEKQRIILARALYKKFDVLLLDEALSEVDYHFRTKIVSNINNYYKDKTIIMVSHNEEKYKFDKVINLTVRKDWYVR